jgi:uncharacterized 2Fe-2S/4Fe-4S cluster protein (DUF4445 family)
MKISLPSGKSISVAPQTSILDALEMEGIYLTSSCGGKGVCGKCKVIVRSGDVDRRSTIKLSQEEVEEGYALACQSYPLGDIVIDIPKESVLTVEGRIATGRSKDLLALLQSLGVGIEPLSERILLELPPPTLTDNISDLERLKRELMAKGLGCLRVPFRSLKGLAGVLREKDWQITISLIHSEDCHEIINIFPGDRRSPRYGVAVDIGTTTLVLYLIDLTDGTLVDAASIYNSQIRFGDDVITRIVYATEHNELRALKQAVIADINIMLSMLIKKHGIEPDAIDQIVVAGNTTMTHLFLGLDPSSIREEPYIPTANTFPISFAGEHGIKARPHTPVYVFPCVASYMGGDIVSGVIATRLHKQEELSFFLDIGTNGEMVLGNSEWLISASCSAGPCFEGSGIKHGMRATEGAIEDIVIDRDTLEPRIKVIGDVRPMGICGSGMIDAISELFLTGILDQKGVLHKEASRRVREGEDGLEFLIYSDDDREIVLTTPDIENIIRAKAAIYAGFTTLLKEVGFTFNDIHKIYIAGGFGKFLDIEKAIILGMLPDLPKERFEFVGNTSIKGAYLCSLSRRLRDEAEEVARRMTYLELSVSKSFMDEFVSGLFIPHTHIEDFPSVSALMKR